MEMPRTGKAVEGFNGLNGPNKGGANNGVVPSLPSPSPTLRIEETVGAGDRDRAVTKALFDSNMEGGRPVVRGKLAKDWYV